MCPVNILFVINEGTPLGMFDEDLVTRHVCATTSTTTTMAIVIAETSALNIFAYTYTQAELCVCAQFTA